MIERKNGDDIMDKFAWHRQQREQTLIGVAQDVGIAHTTLYRYELGKRRVPFFVIELLCEYFGFKLIIKDRKGRTFYESK